MFHRCPPEYINLHLNKSNERERIRREDECVNGDKDVNVDVDANEKEDVNESADANGGSDVTAETCGKRVTYMNADTAMELLTSPNYPHDYEK